MIPRRFGLLPLCAALSFTALAITGNVRGEAETGSAVPGVEQGVPGHFTFASVVRRADELAAEPYQPDQPALPPFFANLDYDQYRDIRFRRNQSLWRAESLPFQAELFPRGCQGAALRAERARPGHRHRAAEQGGVPGLS